MSTPGSERRDEMVERHLGLARSLARRFADRGEPLDDLEQVARLGLVRAVDRFDPDRGVPFATFAVPTIVGEIKRHFRDRTWAVRVPRRIRDLVPVVGAAAGRLRARDGTATADDIASDLGLDVELVLAALEASAGYRSLAIDTPAGAVVPDPVDQLGRVVDRQVLEGLLCRLSERDRRIVVLTWYADWTQERVARTVGLSQTQVSRILRRSSEVMAETRP